MVEETARKFHTPLAIPLMDLTVEKDTLLDILGVPAGEAAAAKKCWACGCLHGSLDAIDRALPAEKRPKGLNEAVHAAREHLTDVLYDCLGCEVCYPALAVNALDLDAPCCPTEEVEERHGWPPFPGAYTVLRYQAPVAVCTLTDRDLAAAIVREAGPEVPIVGILQTENLGIERLLLNVLSNPHIRFIILCGPDSRQAIGHLPGQSLLALSRSGLDDRARIIGGNGKRPVLKNISRQAVEHFRAPSTTGRFGVRVWFFLRRRSVRKPWTKNPIRVTSSAIGPHEANRRIPWKSQRTSDSSRPPAARQGRIKRQDRATAAPAVRVRLVDPGNT